MALNVLQRVVDTSSWRTINYYAIRALFNYERVPEPNAQPNNEPFEGAHNTLF